MKIVVYVALAVLLLMLPGALIGYGMYGDFQHACYGAGIAVIAPIIAIPFLGVEISYKPPSKK